MTELISTKIRKARKPHTCDYCGEVINPGETYTHTVLKYEDIYTWNSHRKCEVIASEIYDMVDPDIGMTGEEFQEACAELCRLFICPDCDQLEEDEECKKENLFCTDKLLALMKTHDLKRERDKYGWFWHFVPRKEERDHEN